MPMYVRDITQFLETIAPPVYQESYDNAGLIVGDPKMEVTGVLTCLDSTEEVLEEALDKGCNLIVAHHPIVFRALKQLTGGSYVERVLIKALKNDLAIFAIHTNLDNVLQKGVNERIGQRLGLKETRILAPKADTLQMLHALLPANQLAGLRQELAERGIEYFSVLPQIDDAELLVRVPAPVGQLHSVEATLASFGGALNSRQTVLNRHPEIGSGLFGLLPEAMTTGKFLEFLRDRMQTACIRHTRPLEGPIQKIALCGGAGGFLLGAAKSAGADVFITADYKYHEFFDADGAILIADIGHFESEQFTIELLQEVISQKFSTFATYCTAVRTNPVHYFV